MNFDKVNHSILIFAEDPGAVNMIAPFSKGLIENDKQVSVFSAGLASELFADAGIDSIKLKSKSHAIEQFHKIKPSRVYIGTSENQKSLGFELIDIAKESRIQVIGIVDSFSNSEYRFKGTTEDPLAYAPDWLMVTNDQTKVAFRDLGFNSSHIKVVGNPQDDFVLEKRKILDKKGKHQIRKKVFSDVPEDRKIIIFLSEISDGLNSHQYKWSDEYTLHGRGQRLGRTETVIEEFLDAIANEKKNLEKEPYLVLRLHPKESKSSLDIYEGEFDMVSQYNDPLDLIYAADYVVGMTSMLLNEAYLLGANVLSILPKESEKHWLSIIKDQKIDCVIDRQALRENIKSFFSCESFKNIKRVNSSIIKKKHTSLKQMLLVDNSFESLDNPSKS
tara:strand:- start:2342 stop:3508 length:1167 start_codon:yes stop_codon:yes gene_type:complete